MKAIIAFLKKYKAFIIGLVVTRLLTLILISRGVILVDNNEVITNVIGFLFYWLLISLIIHKLPYFKKNKTLVFRFLGLITLFILVLIFDSHSDMPDHPVTISLLVVFHLAVVYVILPKFFKTYQWLIIGVYAIALGVFVYYRLFYGTFEAYSQQKTELFILLLGPIPCFMGLWIYQQWKWFQELKTEKAEAELAMLQAQINPHFFFNTLNNLYALTLKNSEQAPEVILKLSDMMRYTIYEGKKDRVNIGDEINYLSNYIELHKIRHKKKVDIRFENKVNPDLKIAPLLFIILLENAFKHGVETLSDSAYIYMNLHEKKGHIHFEIENNFEPNTTIESKGIGLSNLNRRLDLLYKNDYNLHIEQPKANHYKTVLIVPAYV